MKKLSALALSLVLALLAGFVASASEPDSEWSQVWKGTGAMFGPDGTAQGHYAVELTRTPISEEEMRQQIEILIPGREPMVMTQSVKMGDKGFRLTSDDGNGAGFNLGEGFITTYTVNEQGAAFASSIVVDGDRMWILRYELRDGAVVRYFRERYTRQ